jgi:hypothetical protein
MQSSSRITQSSEKALLPGWYFGVHIAKKGDSFRWSWNKHSRLLWLNTAHPPLCVESDSPEACVSRVGSRGRNPLQDNVLKFSCNGVRNYRIDTI